MRPVERGPCPVGDDGCELQFREYNHARPHLVKRLGDYCSYCEIHLPTLDVEHMRCKDTNPDLLTSWSNFLVACRNCNSTKGVSVDTRADFDLHLWPHVHRTFEAFIYTAGGVVRLAPGSDPQFLARAKAMFELVGLGKRPGAGLTVDQLLRGSDPRVEQRRQAWNEAVEAHCDLAKCPDDNTVRKWILKTAKATGFWSVWMTVFCDDATMLRALCGEQCFAGTATDRV